MLLVFVCGLAMCASAGAQQPANQVDLSSVSRHPFQVGGLELTISKLDGLVVISSDARDTGVGYMEVRVENVSADFVRFAPSQLVVVGRDGRQASIIYERHNTDRAVVSEVSVAPRAHTEMKYNLSARVKFPAQLYYDGKLLAEIVD
jgi:hypothetical protein